LITGQPADLVAGAAVGWADVAAGKTGLVAVFAAMDGVAEIDAPVGETVKVGAVTVLVDVGVGDELMAVLVALLVAVIMMGVFDGTMLVFVAVLAVANAWAVKTIMVGIWATSIVGTGSGTLIPVVEQASIKAKINMEKKNVRFTTESPFINWILRILFLKAQFCALGQTV
jgi:hypothetical protein